MLTKRVLPFCLSMLVCLFPAVTFSAALEKCADSVVITQVGNYSTSSDGLVAGDLTVWAGGKGYEWRSRYGVEDKVINQSMSLALFAKSTGAKVDIYCGSATQTYTARLIVVKN